MANNNVQNVRFLRNGNLFNSRQEAINTLTGYTLTAEMDGSAILARYQGASSEPIKTLVGFVYFKDASNKSITIFDIDDAGADVDQKINELRTEIEKQLGTGITSANTATEQLAALSGNSSTDTSATTSVEGAKKYAKDYTDSVIDGLDYTGVTTGTGVYIKNVTQTDGIIAAETESLPTVAAISETGKPITAVSESLGEISATAGTINAEYVDIADTGSLITATNVEGALAEIAAEIDGMDLAVVSGDGEVITAVSEEDGKVSASKTAIKDVKLTGYVKNTTATGAISATDDIEDALSKLENTIGSNAISNSDGSITVTPANGSTTDVKVHIKSGEKVIKLDANQGGIYTDIKIASATPSSTTVKEEYNLLDSDGNALGASIKIYKDSSIVSITYITDPADEHYQNLKYTYIDADGETQVEYVDISALVLEAEFASGITVTNHVAHGVVDPTSENFLTVGTNGFKLAGVQDAINTAISGLDATVGSQTVATGKHVAVEVVEADGVLTTLTVTEDDIASAQGLADEITARGNADTELSNRLGNGVTTANTASVQLSALSGTSADASGVTSVYGAKKYAQEYADEKVAAIVDGLDATVSGETADGKVNVKVTEADGVITTVDVVGTDIASASALTAEIAARKAVDGQNGDTYAANTSSPYISGATSLNDADVKLAAALKALNDDTVKQVKVNNVALTETDNAVNVQISAAAGTGASATPIVISTDNNTGAVTIQLEGLDCGTYN